MYLTEKETAEIARFTPEQAKSSEESLKHYRDLKNSLDTAHEEGYEEGFVEGIEEGRKEGIEEGRKEGIEEGRKEIIINLHNSGMDIEDIAKLTKIDIETVQNILSNAK